MSDVSARRNDRWYVSLWRVAIIAIVAIVCLTGRNEAARADRVSWSGTWDTRWRESGAKMELTQRGAEVFGNYPVYGGRIEGKVEGRVLRGQWIEGARSGAITFVLAPDGQTFMGRFDTGEWWTGGRSNNQEASVPLDQTGAREALRTFIMAGNAVRSGALDEIGTAEAVVDFGPAGDDMAPGEKLAAARRLFDLIDLTTVQLLAYGTTAKQVDDFVTELANVVASVPSSVPSRTLISVNAMTTDGIELGLICYLDVATQAQELSARTTLNMGILRLAEKLGIVLGKRETAS